MTLSPWRRELRGRGQQTSAALACQGWDAASALAQGACSVAGHQRPSAWLSSEETTGSEWFSAGTLGRRKAQGGARADGGSLGAAFGLCGAPLASHPLACHMQVGEPVPGAL